MAFDHKELILEIQDQYLADDNNRPWIVGFSGGKDSTLLLQLTWLAVKKISEANRTRPIYVVCNNTLVENPKVIEFVEGVLGKIQKAAHEQSMPVFVKQTTPALEDTFWVNLIGKGYPSPNNVFRWCTERLKINPTTKFILEKISDSGEVIILLGTRSDESSNRAKNLKKREVKGSRLRKHILQNAYVYAAIKDVKTDDLWQYLAQVPSPWGASNKELITLYKNANSGDCPLVIDKTTPSCGNSRFGCWVCTVVKRDKSMEALIENGEDWMEPLMELRDLLAASRDDENAREKKRKDGTEEDGKLGPYKPKFRADFLESLLKAQKEIQVEQPDINLINYQELVAIQVLWHRDNIFDFNVAEIYGKVLGRTLDLQDSNDQVIREKQMLKEACQNDNEDFQLINELLALQKSKTILMKNYGLQNDLENHLEKVVKNSKTS
ncbi:DNA phosphorothioation system sulfurtransferase DndC [Croceitalea marina]|uniref:DNA phosphorothioation system sulfurtransferase DndC n=1 Tax=Croceitalea marina TaxID=1775166 RepID=A0ABW5MSG7_9FLAO